MIKAQKNIIMPIFAISTLYLFFSWHLERLSDIFGIETCIFYLMYNRIKKKQFSAIVFGNNNYLCKHN